MCELKNTHETQLRLTFQTGLNLIFFLRFTFTFLCLPACMYIHHMCALLMETRQGHVITWT